MAYQKDISAILGLSISTVSRALKGYPDISEETRKKVLRTAEELDYRSGKSEEIMMGAQPSGAIGVMAPGFDKMMNSSYYREMLCGMAAESARQKKDLVIMGTDPDKCGMSSIGKATSRRVDGVCLLAKKEDLYEGRFAELLESRIPVISLENYVAGYTAVCRDLRGDVRRLLQYLKERKHLRTAYLGDLSLDSRKVATMFAEEAKMLEMACEGLSPEQFEERMAKYRYAAPGNVTCVICDTYKMAQKVLDLLERSGMKAPEDLSVAALQTDAVDCGGDRITCVRNCPEKMGETAIRRIIQVAEHPETDVGERILVGGTICDGITVKDIGGIYTRNF